MSNIMDIALSSPDKEPRKKKETRPPLLIREQFETIIVNLTDAERGKLLIAMMRYQWHDEIMNLPDKLKIYFELLRSFIDEDNKKYDDKRESNRQNAYLRWQNQNTQNNENE